MCAICENCGKEFNEKDRIVYAYIPDPSFNHLKNSWMYCTNFLFCSEKCMEEYAKDKLLYECHNRNLQIKALVKSENEDYFQPCIERYTQELEKANTGKPELQELIRKASLAVIEHTNAERGKFFNHISM